MQAFNEHSASVPRLNGQFQHLGSKQNLNININILAGTQMNPMYNNYK